jgi:hypothetical protein
MAVVLDATVGGPSANSYCTVAEATAVLDVRLHSGAWTAATPDDQARALISATRLLDDQVGWYGTPTTTTQALAWPMQGQVDSFGRPVDPTTIPQDVKDATATYGLALLEVPASTVSVSADAGIKSKRLGDTSVTYRDTVLVKTPAQQMPLEIRRMLTPYGTVAGNVMVPLVRG